MRQIRQAGWILLRKDLSQTQEYLRVQFKFQETLNQQKWSRNRFIMLLDSQINYHSYIDIILNKYQMQPHQTLEKKFTPVIFRSAHSSRLPVSGSLKQILSSESSKIKHISDKKKYQERSLQRVSASNLNYRQNLRKKLIASQDKNTRNKSKFLEEKVKKEKWKIKQVEDKRKEKAEQQMELERQKAELVADMNTQSRIYWNKKLQNSRKQNLIQTLASPVYHDAVYRKKVLEFQNSIYGEVVKKQFKERHQTISSKRKSILEENKKKLDVHNKQIEENLKKNWQIMSSRQKKYVNSICFHQQRSKSLVKLNKSQWKDRLDKKIRYQNENLRKTRQNLKEKEMKRTQTMNECRCKKSENRDDRLTFSMNNDEENELEMSKSHEKKLMSKSLTNMTSSFRMSTKLHRDVVRMNKEYMRQKNERQDERRIMHEKEISEALQVKNQLKNESNCLIRKTRLAP